MVTVTGGFDYTGTDNNFGRDVYETLALMKAVKAAKMPQMAFALCREDGKLYSEHHFAGNGDVGRHFDCHHELGSEYGQGL